MNIATSAEDGDAGLARGTGKVAQIGGAQQLTLVSYLNRGRDFQLFAAIDGMPLDLPAGGLESPKKGELVRLVGNHRLQLVSTGTLDSIGTASVSVDRALGGAELFFAVLDPASHRLLSISGSTRLPVVP